MKEALLRDAATGWRSGFRGRWAARSAPGDTGALGGACPKCATRFASALGGAPIRFVLALLPVALPLIAFSCGADGDGRGGGTEYEIDRSYKRGPVSFRVALSSGEITIADRLTMLLEARASEGCSVELPRFGEKLEQFGIVDYSSPPPELGDGGVVVTRLIYELEPFLSGDYKVPPMTVTFRQEGDTLLHKVESDTITVHVRSILPEDGVELEIKDIAGPVSFPSNRARTLLIAGCAIVVIAAVILLGRRRRRKAGIEPPIPAHEIAYLRLEQLLSSGMLDEKRYREFTAEVSNILRYYIEDRFGLKAPERTTEEFLAEAGVGLPVDSMQKKILAEFLRHCDLVKFAALEPSSDDVKRTFETCRDFIDSTRQGEEVKGEAA